jgi:hypothetical protein
VSEDPLTEMRIVASRVAALVLVEGHGGHDRRVVGWKEKKRGRS